MKIIRVTFSVALIVLNQIVFAQTGSWNFAGNNLAGTEKLGSTNNAALNFVTSNKTRMSLTGAGNLKFSSDQSSIQFPAPTASNKPMIFMFPSALSNPSRMVIAHSPAFSNWGLQYNDSTDKFDFLKEGQSVFNVTLGTKIVGVAGHFTVDGNVGIGNVNAFSSSELFIQHKDGLQHGLALRNDLATLPWTISQATSVGGSGLQLGFNNVRVGFFDPSSGTYSSISDSRVKKDIEPAPTVLEKVMQLQVKKYHFVENQSADKKHYGMIAQDVEKLFPEVVYHPKDSSHEHYSMNYSAFGVIAIKAIQEQQKKIEGQEQKIQEQEQTIQQQQQKIITFEERIAKLEAMINNRSIGSTNNSNMISKEISSASLEQNQPNPFNQNTMIRYHLSQGTPGQINLYDTNGTLVKTLKADESGQAVINGSDLKAGTYSYTLLVNNKMIASKKLVLIK